MTSQVATTVETLRYGASEFKGIIDRNTRKAGLVTLLLLLFIILLKFTYPIIEGWFFPPPNVVTVRLAKVSLDALPPPPSNLDEPPPPPPPVATPPPSGPAARAGTPVAVPDALLDPDLVDFANMDEIDRASAVGGDGDDYGGFSDNIGEQVVITERETDADPDEFVAVEKEPQFDYADLQRRVKYPDIARRNNIEGQVLVGAYVGKDGRVEKTHIYSSDNELLDKAAVAAVRETVFTPAIQNGHPVKLWVRIPIQFRLR